MTGTYLAGIGATGALLAGAAIIFVTLVGMTSFNVWPEGGSTSAMPGTIELSPADAGGGSASLASTPPIPGLSGRQSASGGPLGSRARPASAPGKRGSAPAHKAPKTSDEGGGGQPKSSQSSKDLRKAQHEAEKVAKRAEKDQRKAAKIGGPKHGSYGNGHSKKAK